VRQLIEQDVRKAYQQPALNRLTLRQAIQALLGRARDLLPFFSPDPKQSVREEVPKKYQKPTLRKITPEQASLMLLGHASVGDQGAKDLLAVIFPDETEPSEHSG
jgi:hypothetical protein